MREKWADELVDPEASGLAWAAQFATLSVTTFIGGDAWKMVRFYDFLDSASTDLRAAQQALDAGDFAATGEALDHATSGMDAAAASYTDFLRSTAATSGALADAAVFTAVASVVTFASLVIFLSGGVAAEGGVLAWEMSTAEALGLSVTSAEASGLVFASSFSGLSFATLVQWLRQETPVAESISVVPKEDGELPTEESAENDASSDVLAACDEAAEILEDDHSATNPCTPENAQSSPLDDYILQGIRAKAATQCQSDTPLDMIGLATQNLIDWKQAYDSQLPDPDFNHAEFLLPAALVAKGSQSCYEQERLEAQWQEVMRAATTAVRAASLKGADCLDQIRAARDSVYDTLLKNYGGAQGSLIDFFASGLGNCDAETQFLLALITAIPISLDFPYRLAVQVFDGHVQAVIFNEINGRVWEILTGHGFADIDKPGQDPDLLRGDVYDDAEIYAAYLREQGEELPYDDSLLLLHRAEADGIVEGAEVPPTTSFLTWPQAANAYSSDAVPERAILSRPADAMVPSVASGIAGSGIARTDTGVGFGYTQASGFSLSSDGTEVIPADWGAGWTSDLLLKNGCIQPPHDSRQPIITSDVNDVVSLCKPYGYSYPNSSSDVYHLQFYDVNDHSANSIYNPMKDNILYFMNSASLMHYQQLTTPEQRVRYLIDLYQDNLRLQISEMDELFDFMQDPQRMARDAQGSPSHSELVADQLQRLSYFSGQIRNFLLHLAEIFPDEVVANAAIRNPNQVVATSDTYNALWFSPAADAVMRDTPAIVDAFRRVADFMQRVHDKPLPFLLYLNQLSDHDREAVLKIWTEVSVNASGYGFNIQGLPHPPQLALEPLLRIVANPELLDIEERPGQAASWVRFEISDSPASPVNARLGADGKEEHTGQAGTASDAPPARRAPYAISPATYRDILLFLRDTHEHRYIADTLTERWNENVSVEMLKIPVTDGDPRWVNLQMLSVFIPGFDHREHPENAHLQRLADQFQFITY